MNTPGGKRWRGIDAHPVVFPASAGLLLVFVALAMSFPSRSAILFARAQTWVSAHFAWLYIAAMTGFLLFALVLCFGRFGSIRLGSDNSKPEFSRLSWFAMLFSAGMGIGMLFYGVVEPMTHYLNPAVGQGGTLAAARQAQVTTLFHWCLQPWALYALVGLSIAYFGFRKDLPLSLRSVFYPLLGERIRGRWGDAIDIMAVLATLFGLATSLGLGVKQVNAGLNFVFGWPEYGSTVQVILIGSITLLAVASLVSGLHAGIKWLSNINMVIAGLLLVFVFVAGPTVYLLGALVENAGNYLAELPARSFWTATYAPSDRTEWFSSWTIFYWGWWISWSPFVGMFIARISRGRTIREFLLGVLLVPSAVAIVWMTGFGNASVYLDREAVAESKSVGNVSGKQRSYPVAVLDSRLRLPLSRSGHPVIEAGSGNRDVSVLLQPAGEAPGPPGVYVTLDGQNVRVESGVLILADSGQPYRAGPLSTFAGRYQTKPEQLSLGGFLSKAVVNDRGTRLVDTTSTAMFAMLRSLPLAPLTAVLAMLSVVLFFITSSDSASMVADIISSGGRPDPSVATRLFWGILEGLLAAALLLSGGLRALQAGAILLGLPFCLIVVFMCFSLWLGLSAERPGVRAPKALSE